MDFSFFFFSFFFEFLLNHAVTSFSLGAILHQRIISSWWCPLLSQFNVCHCLFKLPLVMIYYLSTLTWTNTTLGNIEKKPSPRLVDFGHQGGGRILVNLLKKKKFMTKIFSHKMLNVVLKSSGRWYLLL